MTNGPSSPARLGFLATRLAAWRQTSAQVFKREPGDRFLSGPFNATPSGREEYDFALLSVAAYSRSDPLRIKHRQPLLNGPIRASWSIVPGKKLPPADLDVDTQLNKRGWTMWPAFPDAALEQQMEQSHLRAEVWEHPDTKRVVVAFGGTVFTSGKDWKSNLRWFFPFHKDEYTEIVSRFGPDFVKYFLTWIESKEDQAATIYSTGHSLGGGLAQQFAYALPPGTLMQKVAHVYAFDPSPVTGFFSVPKAVRDYNKKGLKITRSYERGEILAILRSFTSVLVKPSVVNPVIQGVRFALFYPANVIAGHSIDTLAAKMAVMAPLPGGGNPPSSPAPATSTPNAGLASSSSTAANSVGPSE